MHYTILCYIFCLFSNLVNLGRYIRCCKNKMSLNYPIRSMWYLVFYHSHYWELGWYRLLITVELFGIFCPVWEEVKNSSPFPKRVVCLFFSPCVGQREKGQMLRVQGSKGSLWKCQSGDPRTHHRQREHTRQRHRGPGKDSQWAA